VEGPAIGGRGLHLEGRKGEARTRRELMTETKARRTVGLLKDGHKGYYVWVLAKRITDT
jgi:hypothetical protein